jgi:FkbM family methyltransferase
MAALIPRIQSSFASARECATMIGWKWVIADRVLRRLGIREVRLKAAGLDNRVACRVSTSDIFEYMHHLGRAKVPFKSPIQPEFIIDAGANVGYSALRFQKVFPGATIISLEPEPSNIIQFKKNCCPYSNIVLEEKALWSTSTRLRIRSLNVDQNAFQVEEDPHGEVEGVSVHDLMRRHGLPRIDLLKMDTEGSEKVVFSHPNAKDWLRSVATIMVETHDRLEPGCTEAVKLALGGEFDFRGMIDEYAFFVSRRIDEFGEQRSTSTNVTYPQNQLL